MSVATTGAGTTAVAQSDDDDDEVAEDSSTDTATEGDEDYDKERALNTIKAQRASERKYKTQLTEALAELKQIKDKDLPEQERAKSERDEAVQRAEKAEQQLKKAAVRTVALEEATNLKFRNPTLAYRLIDHDEVEYDGDEPSNIKALLKDLLKQDPYLKGRRQTEEGDEDEEDDDAGAGRGRKPRAFDMNSEIRRQAGR